MAYWQRVTVQSPTLSQTDTGAEVKAPWVDHLADVEARLLPLVESEKDTAWATPEEQAYEVQLRGAQPTVLANMRVVTDGQAFDIRQVTQPPPFGTPTTVLHAVLVTP